MAVAEKTTQSDAEVQPEVVSAEQPEISSDQIAEERMNGKKPVILPTNQFRWMTELLKHPAKDENDEEIPNVYDVVQELPGTVFTGGQSHPRNMSQTTMTQLKQKQVISSDAKLGARAGKPNAPARVVVLISDFVEALPRNSNGDSAITAKEPSKRGRKPGSKNSQTGTVVVNADGTPKRKAGRPSKQEIALRASNGNVATATLTNGSKLDIIVALAEDVKAIQKKYPAAMVAEFLTIK